LKIKVNIAQHDDMREMNDVNMAAVNVPLSFNTSFILAKKTTL